MVSKKRTLEAQQQAKVPDPPEITDDLLRQSGMSDDDIAFFHACQNADENDIIIHPKTGDRCKVVDSPVHIAISFNDEIWTKKRK